MRQMINGCLHKLFYLFARSVRTVWVKLATPMLITFKPTALLAVCCCLVPVLYNVIKNLFLINKIIDIELSYGKSKMLN